jgi:hypothetical protein
LGEDALGEATFDVVAFGEAMTLVFCFLIVS